MTTSSASLATFVAALIPLGCAISPALAADARDAVHGPAGPGSTRYVIPDSSIEKPDDVGRRAHTTYGIGVPPPVTGPGQTYPAPQAH